LNKTVDWAWDITNFVWWIGIGHAGTLDLSDLVVVPSAFRTGINRAAEAMTIFAVICAGMFPVFHMGRVWMAFFIFPYPNTRGPLMGKLQLTTCFGTYLLSLLISLYRCCSGIQV
jgi:hypothetical protein